MFRLMFEIILLPFRVVQAVILVASFPLRVLVGLFGGSSKSSGGSGNGDGGIGKRFGE